MPSDPAPANKGVAPPISICRWSPKARSDSARVTDALAHHLKDNQSEFVLLLAESFALPPHAEERLVDILRARTEIAVVGLMSPASDLTNPIRPGATLPAPIDLAGLDSFLFLQQHPATWESADIPAEAAVVRVSALASLGALPESWPECLIQLRAAGYRTSLTGRVFTADPHTSLTSNRFEPDPDHLQPASALFSIQLAMTPALESTNLAHCWPGYDGKPVQLHLLHGWGGGAQKWVNDYAQADQERNNLVLVSEGNPISRDHGQWLVLYSGSRDAPPIRRWPLYPAIDCVSLGHQGYTAVLNLLLAQLSVDGIVVSSLIGHCLEALDTRLPVAVVLHDYFPAWPRLDLYFSEDSQWDDGALKDAISNLPEQFEFKPHDPDYWYSLRQQYLSKLAGKTLIAPSSSVEKNLHVLTCELEADAIQVIPHGIASLRPIEYEEPARGEKLRILILGRMSRNKGEALLRACLPTLREVAEFYLLGAGRGGKPLMSESGIHVVDNYQPEELETLVAEIQPHMGMLLSTVAETFSYTLSEILALGLPVVATAAGNIADVLSESKCGLICDLKADSITDTVNQLARRPEQLAAMAQAARAFPHRSVESMVASHQAAFVLQPQAQRDDPVIPLTGTLNLATANQALLIEQDRLSALAKLKTAADQELAERAEWAFGLERNLQEKSAWAEALDAELADTKESWQEVEDRYARDMSAAQRVREKLQTEFDDRTRWALELDDMRIQNEAEIQRLSAIEEQRNRMLNSRSWRMTAPVRKATQRLRALRDRARFAATRAAFNLRRVRNSLRTRGISGTVRRASTELGRGEAPPTVRPPPAVDFSTPIHFQRSAAPQASIIIPVFNAWSYTEACLRSLSAAADLCEFEVIVVNDASSDQTTQNLDQLEDVDSIHNEQNLGFIGSCNAGAQRARGEFLVFLNNDTTVTPGWLDALVHTFEAHPKAGLVGAKLIYPDGTLQEAGGIIFEDGSGWNFGRGEDPSLPEFEYLRRADYISGAAIAVRRNLFESLGRFDSRYAPAYYEDTDLAFQVREAGYEVIYQPRSVVVHYEGVSSGTDLSSGTKRYQVINQKKFVERWEKALTRQPRPGTPIHLAATHRHQTRVLVVDACTPTPDQDSGSVRITNLMQLLVGRGFHVSFLAHNMAYEGRYTQALQSLGVQALYQPYVATPHSWLREFGADLDYVFVSRYYVAADYVELLRSCCPKARFVFDTVDLHFLREERLAELEQDEAIATTAERTKSTELGVAAAADVTLVVSPHEKTLLGRIAPDLNVEVLSNIHHVPGRSQPFEKRQDIWFVGGFQHPPNVDAVHYCVKEILPLLRAELPDLKLIVVGSKAPAELRELSAPGLEFRGFVEDLEPLLNGCRLAIAPLRYGAGVKGKVNMSMSHGQPVVATPPAVEGMYVEHGVEVMVGESAAQFAEHIIRVYSDPELWLSLSDAGIANVRKHFSFDAAELALDKILAR